MKRNILPLFLLLCFTAMQHGMDNYQIKTFLHYSTKKVEQYFTTLSGTVILYKKSSNFSEYESAKDLRTICSFQLERLTYIKEFVAILEKIVHAGDFKLVTASFFSFIEYYIRITGIDIKFIDNIIEGTKKQAIFSMGNQLKKTLADIQEKLKIYVEYLKELKQKLG